MTLISDNFTQIFSKQRALVTVLLLLLITFIYVLETNQLWGLLDKLPGSNWYGYHEDVGMHSKNASKRQIPKKVLLVTSYRGGSTFLGELFNENLKAMYWFEPLYPLYQNSWFKDK